MESDIKKTGQDIADAVVHIEKTTGKVVDNLRIDDAGIFISFKPKPCDLQVTRLGI